jgi:hypothetical protein
VDFAALNFVAEPRISLRWILRWTHGYRYSRICGGAPNFTSLEFAANLRISLCSFLFFDGETFFTSFDLAAESRFYFTSAS